LLHRRVAVHHNQQLGSLDCQLRRVDCSLGTIDPCFLAILIINLMLRHLVLQSVMEPGEFAADVG
jgi:hypothetical protein